MKGFVIAAIAAVGVTSAVPASAQHVEQRTTTTIRTTNVERHDNGWHRGPRWVKKHVCKTAWHHHRKVRRCAMQRVRVR